MASRFDGRAHAVVTNKSDRSGATRVQLTAYDGSGAVLDTTSRDIVVPGKAEIQLDLPLDIPSGMTVAKFESRTEELVGADKYLTELDEAKGTGAITTAKVSLLADKGSPRVTGTVVSTYGVAVTDVTVVALCKAENGAVVATGTTHVAELSPGVPVPFATEFMRYSAGPKSCTVTAGPTLLSEFR